MSNHQALSEKLSELVEVLKNKRVSDKPIFKYNQEGALLYISYILKQSKKGVVVADEVGMGKTRVAIFTMLANALNGQSSLVIVPPGLIHQWDKEWYEVIEQIEKLNIFEGKLKKIDGPIKLQRIEDIFCQKDYPLIKEGRPRVVIIPHSLSMRVSNVSRLKSIDLPQMIRSQDKKITTYHSRSKKHLRDFYETNEEWDYGENKVAASKYLLEFKDKLFTTDHMENEASEIDLIEKEEFHFSKKDSSNRYQEFTKYFRQDKTGFRIYFKSFFKLIGDYSLIVIDEAHKTKSDSGQDGVLGTVIKYARRKKENKVFTIGMTATPVELSPEEWTGIIHRIGEKIEDTEIKSKIISGFNKALKDIRRSPNSIIFQNEILKTSKGFENFLNKTVTRRVRLFKDEFQELLEMGKLDKRECFPHHNRKPIVISQDELLTKDPLWIDIAFYYEAINKASKGHTGRNKQKAKLLDKTFARGNLNLDYINELVTDLEQGLENAQEKRILYWAKSLQVSLKEANSKKSLHPRLEKTLALVDSILFDKDTGDFKNEKVLIFTTFNESAEELNSLINLRLTLKIIDQGKLIPISKRYIEELSKAYQDSPKNIFRGNLKDLDCVKHVLESFRVFYEKNRKKIVEKVDETIFTEETFVGDHFFKNSKEGLGIIKNFFSIQILEELFVNVRFQYSKESEIEFPFSNEIFKEIISKQWKQIVTDYLSNEDIEDDLNESTDQVNSLDSSDPVTQGYSREERFLDSYIDRIDVEELKGILQNFLGEDEDISQPTSKISRRICGATKMNARKNVQSLFNDEKRFPKVLVAQSRVGREGLNLHKACRNLILFHQEWNPGVIEQQIGRIDRIDSFWEKILREWHKNGASGDAPKINIYNIVFEGTYDEHQALVLDERSKNLRAQLFGGILTEENLKEVSDEIKKEIKDCAPNFSPKKFLTTHDLLKKTKIEN